MHNKRNSKVSKDPVIHRQACHIPNFYKYYWISFQFSILISNWTCWKFWYFKQQRSIRIDYFTSSSIFRLQFIIGKKGRIHLLCGLIFKLPVLISIYIWILRKILIAILYQMDIFVILVIDEPAKNLQYLIVQYP